MTDLYKLLDANIDVAVFPDPDTADDLRKLRKFWKGIDDEDVANEHDLSALSDVEIAKQLDALGVTDIELPAQTRNLLNAPQESRPWLHRLAIATCLAGGVAIGVLGTANKGGNSIETVPDQISASGLKKPNNSTLGSYLLRSRQVVGQIIPDDETGLGFRTVRLPALEERLDLSRVELRELQFLLNQFDFGPVAQLGLPSADTDRAILRFRQAHGLAVGGADHIVLEILRELAHKKAFQNLNDQDDSNSQLKGDTP